MSGPSSGTRLQNEDEVTICIPTWQAEGFIERTLEFALGQTHRAIRVMVSVDQCEDATADLCLARAEQDPRLEVLVQPERLGWAGNVNALFDRVETPFCFVYFHDDFVVPRYVESLLAALRSQPDAMSAHCDMGTFGARDKVVSGFNYTRDVETRLASFLLTPRLGAPFRSLLRKRLLDGGLRIPSDDVAGLLAGAPFLFELFAGGPALRVPETLYHHWVLRPGGLTHGWKSASVEQVRRALARNVDRYIQTIQRVVQDAHAQRRLEYYVYLHLMRILRSLELERGAETLIEPAALHPAFAGYETPPPLGDIDPQLAELAELRLQELQKLEDRARSQGVPR
jgi:glycosyltransferase involved in cell wall biosynthesis